MAVVHYCIRQLMMKILISQANLTSVPINVGAQSPEGNSKMILHIKDSIRWRYDIIMQRYWSEETIILFLHYKSILYNQTSVLKYSRISCQCHTNLPATSVGMRLCNHLWCMFFWKVWHHCLGAPSVPSFITLTTYQTSHSHSGKLIFPVGLWLLLTHTTQTQTQSGVFEFELEMFQT